MLENVPALPNPSVPEMLQVLGATDHQAENVQPKPPRDDSSARDQLRSLNVAGVVPAYNEERSIAQTLATIPDYVRWIIVVDDASSDQTPRLIDEAASRDPRIVTIRHLKNRGLGAGMVEGYQKALELNAGIVVKMDGDGQMSPDDLPALLAPLATSQADYTKGNRFRDFQMLRKMPVVRRMGNMVLSFLTKAGVGYWHLFDPCNGYVAIRGDVLRQLPLDSVGRSFFFETSMLAQLYLAGAVVKDVPMSARYGDETSHLSIHRVLWEFPGRLLGCFTRRILLKCFLYDFSMQSLYLLATLFFLGLGTVYGGYHWVWFAMHGQGAPTGTVVLSSMLIVLGFQLLLAAIGEDLRAVPREPLGRNRPDAAYSPQSMFGAAFGSPSQVQSGEGTTE